MAATIKLILIPTGDTAKQRAVIDVTWEEAVWALLLVQSAVNHPASLLEGAEELRLVVINDVHDLEAHNTD